MRQRGTKERLRTEQQGLQIQLHLVLYLKWQTGKVHQVQKFGAVCSLGDLVRLDYFELWRVLEMHLGAWLMLKASKKLTWVINRLNPSHISVRGISLLSISQRQAQTLHLRHEYWLTQLVELARAPPLLYSGC